ACGADLTEEADSGYTPMDLAVALGHKKGKWPPPTGYRESHPEAVPEQEEEEEMREAAAPALPRTAMASSQPGAGPGTEKSGNFCPLCIQTSPKIQGYSFQPWLGSAAPCFPLEVNS
ncbi:RFXK protein, partial [Polioptila caerulea]|nr:RFXK protein [Polioptila caerulea]